MHATSVFCFASTTTKPKLCERQFHHFLARGRQHVTCTKIAKQGGSFPFNGPLWVSLFGQTSLSRLQLPLCSAPSAIQHEGKTADIYERARQLKRPIRSASSSPFHTDAMPSRFRKAVKSARRRVRRAPEVCDARLDQAARQYLVQQRLPIDDDNMQRTKNALLQANPEGHGHEWRGGVARTNEGTISMFTCKHCQSISDRA